MVRNLCKQVISSGGDLLPLLISPVLSKGLGLMNPSIYLDGDNIYLNIRNVNYTLYHCENGQVFNNRYGPLSYLNPENDIKLRTENFFCLLKDDLTIDYYHHVDTTKHDVEPLWEFIGLEDCRVVKWDGKLFLCGVRRDTTTNGQGRMEMSEIAHTKQYTREINRTRIEAPNDKDSYCEKNWMPVNDLPYHFVKWTCPTEVVKVDLETGTSETVFLGKEIPVKTGLRGSSSVITYGDYYICIVHEVDLWKNKLNQKDAKYTHRFVVWDKQWNIIEISDSFSFMDGEIEFCCGLAENKNGDLLITFGFQDNAAYLLRVPEKFIKGLIDVTKKNAKV